MSTNELAIVEPYHAPAARLDSWVGVVGDVAKLAEHIAETEFVPRGLRGNPAAITAAILYGREVGLPPMQALRWVHVIDGSPALAAESQRALVLAAGHEIVFPVSTGARCVCRGRRRGSGQWHEVEWTTETAKLAGLLGGGPRSAWSKYPRSMLKARASAELCRDVFPDITGGFAAVEEMGVMPEDGAVRPVETPEVATGVVGRGRGRKAASDAPSAPSEPKDAGSAVVDAPTPPPSQPDTTTSASDAPAVAPIDHGEWADMPLPLDDDDSATDAQGRHVFALLGDLGVTKRPDRLDVARAVLLRRVESFGELSKSDASKLIDTLAILVATEESEPGQGKSQLQAIVRHWLDTEPMRPEPPFDVITGEVVD